MSTPWGLNVDDNYANREFNKCIFNWKKLYVVILVANIRYAKLYSSLSGRLTCNVINCSKKDRFKTNINSFIETCIFRTACGPLTAKSNKNLRSLQVFSGTSYCAENKSFNMPLFSFFCASLILLRETLLENIAAILISVLRLATQNLLIIFMI